MSVIASKWAWEQPVKGNDKLVLLYLADRAGDNGLSWHGREKIAKYCGFSGDHAKQTVTNILIRLERGGFIRRYKRFAKSEDQTYKRQTSNHVVVLFPDRDMDLDMIEEGSAYNPPKLENLPPLNSGIYQETKEETKGKSSSKREQVAPTEPEFQVEDFEAVLAWILVQFQELGFDFTEADKKFVKGKVQVFQKKYPNGDKADAFSFVDVGLKHRGGIFIRGAKNAAARDKLADSNAKRLNAQAAVIDQHTKNMEPRKRLTLEEKLKDRSWAEGLE